FENSGGGGGGGSSGLPSDVASPPPKPQSQVSAQSPFSAIQSEPQTAYSARTQQFPPPSTPRPSAPMMPQQRPQQFYVPHQQQQLGYSPPESAPPPPPYPGSSSRQPSQTQSPVGWRPQAQPQLSQRYPPPTQYQSQMTYLSPGQQQQQRFTGGYRGMSPNLMPAVPSSSGGSRQSPYPSYETAQQMPPSVVPAPEGGLLSNQQLKTMLRRDLSPRRTMEMPLGVPGGSQQQIPGDVLVPPVLQTQPQTPLPPGFEGGPAISGASGANFVSRRLNSEKWGDEERLGERSSIAPVLYANIMHPTLKAQYPDSRTRFREIQKLWRRLPSDRRSQFVTQARANKTQSRAANTSPRDSGASMHSQHLMMQAAGSGVGTSLSPHVPYSQQPPSAGMPPGAPVGGRSSGGNTTPILPNYAPSPVAARHQPPFLQPQRPPHQMMQQQHISPSSQLSVQSPMQPRVADSSAFSNPVETDQHTLGITQEGEGGSSAIVVEAPVASQRQSPVSAEEQPEQQQPHGTSHFQPQQRDPPSVSASQPSPSLSPSSSILGGSAGGSQRRGGPTSLPPASSHSTEPVSPATPFQQQPYAAVGTPDQSVMSRLPSTPQQQQGAYLPPPLPPPPPAWPTVGSVNSPMPPPLPSSSQQQQQQHVRWSSGIVGGGHASPLSPAQQQQQLMYQQQQQRQQQEMLHQHHYQQQQQQQQQHYIQQPQQTRYATGSMVQQASTPMPQHYGGGVHGPSIHQSGHMNSPSQLSQSSTSLQSPTQPTGPSPGDRERQRLREILAMKMSMSSNPSQPTVPQQSQQQPTQRMYQHPQQQQQMYSHPGSNYPYPAAPPQRHMRPPAPGSFYPGSPSQQQLGFAHTPSPSFESNFIMQQQQQTTRCSSGSSPSVVASPGSGVPGGGGVQPSLCSPPVLPATSVGVGHHQHPHHHTHPETAPPPPPPYQTSTSATAVALDSPHRSPYHAKTPTPCTTTSVEEAGFEPPVIFSRVGTGAVKERPRFIPQQQIQSADTGGSSGEMVAPPQSVAYSQQRMSQQGQEQIPSMGGQAPQYESEYRYHQSPSQQMELHAQTKQTSQFFPAPQRRQSPIEAAVSVSNHSDCPAQYLISESQPSQHYNMGYLPPSYSRVSQPVPGYPSPAQTANHSIYEQTTLLQQQGPSPYATAQTTYTVTPQSPYPGHIPDDQSSHPGEENMQ
ncbi:unnamed protein product, partial [Hymenolepis diminuta]